MIKRRMGRRVEAQSMSMRKRQQLLGWSNLRALCRNGPSPTTGIREIPKKRITRQWLKTAKKISHLIISWARSKGPVSTASVGVG